MITDIPCVILAGGRSSRMGKDKSLLPFGKFDTLIEYQYNKLSKIFSNVYVSSKTNKFNFTENIILDANQEISSPMIALQSIFNKITTNKIFIITVDVPLIKLETIEILLKESSNFAVTIASDKQNEHNLCGVFNHNILPIINKLLSEDIHKINYLLKKTKSLKKVQFINNEQFINMNDYNDYNKALSISKTYKLY